MSSRPDQGGQQAGGPADATTGGGASTERGGRDAGMPGPAPDAVPSSAGGGKRPADSTESEPAGSQAPPPHSALDEATNTVTTGGPSS